MSKLIQKYDNRTTIRWKLLTGVSAVALTACVSSASTVMAEDASQPQIWIELDSQFARQQASSEIFLPPFLFASQFDGVSQIGKMPSSVWDDGAKISFQPEGADWVLSAAIRYGKISRHAAQNQLTAHASKYFNYNAYQDFRLENSESHTILDFQAGKDVGLGKFGSNGTSLLSAGVRYAQFKSRTISSVASQPTNANYFYYRFYDSFDARREFTGVGPSLSWNGSAELAGNPSTSALTLDWGLNGAVLFGRQRTRVQHQVTDKHTTFGYALQHRHLVYQTSASPARSKNVTVPNFGAFAGVSWRLPNAKVTIGYRADMFFGAMDGGIDAAKKENRGFYGPYASISFGIGD